MSRVDVNRTSRIAPVDVSVGRIARLRGSPWERPESTPKPPFHCKHETAFTAETGLFVAQGSTALDSKRMVRFMR
jgi:hypothetical protein